MYSYNAARTDRQTDRLDQGELAGLHLFFLIAVLFRRLSRFSLGSLLCMWEIPDDPDDPD